MATMSFTSRLSHTFDFSWIRMEQIIFSSFFLFEHINHYIHVSCEPWYLKSTQPDCFFDSLLRLTHQSSLSFNLIGETHCHAYNRLSDNYKLILQFTQLLMISNTFLLIKWDFRTDFEILWSISVPLTHLPPGRNGHQLAKDIFISILVNEMFCILFKIPLKFVFKGPIDNKITLV